VAHQRQLAVDVADSSAQHSVDEERRRDQPGRQQVSRAAPEGGNEADESDRDDRDNPNADEQEGERQKIDVPGERRALRRDGAESGRGAHGGEGRAGGTELAGGVGDDERGAGIGCGSRVGERLVELAIQAFAQAHVQEEAEQEQGNGERGRVEQREALTDRHGVCSRTENVSRVSHRVEQSRFALLLELLSEVPHVDFKNVGLHRRVHIPDLAK